ncbi:MAG: hypothetical protein COA43_06590 [Robiginitomaculum sp.]|nr:MAG: hypothetical protein COA43_06590 [Robiginitomaculum sp.]
MSTIQTAILDILESEQIAPSPSAAAMCEKIMSVHEGRVQAMLYYGSSLRAMNDPEKMLDFYVLVDSYLKTHRNPMRALLNYLIPPAVYYLERENEDGTISNCKYSLLSLRAFEAKCTKKAILSQIWGRFSQPCVLLYPKTEEIRLRVQRARADAIRHMASVTMPLTAERVTSIQFWATGFTQSYKTELRPEKSDSRSEEIVTRYHERYTGLMRALYGHANTGGLYLLPTSTKWRKFTCKTMWALRRILGKPTAAIRILNSAATFSGGIDYVLHKLKSHSGVTIDISPSQRKHPILWSPILAWKLYRRGAFK